MTRVEYSPDEMRIEVKGHAGGGQIGEDLVCAAVSALTGTLEEVFLVQHDMQGFIQKQSEGPVFRAWVQGTSPLKAQAFVVMETIATGLAALAEQFPECVSFEITGDGEEKDGKEV